MNPYPSNVRAPAKTEADKSLDRAKAEIAGQRLALKRMS